MAVIRTLVLLGLVGCAGTKRAAGYGAVDVRSSLYADNDATTISTSAVRVQAVATDTVSVSGQHLVDFTSTASVDVVSAATDRWTEFRHETSGGAVFADGTHTASADYIYSQENDWWAHSASLGGSRDLLDHNLTLGLGASWVGNRIGRQDDEGFEETSQIFGGSVSAVVVGSPRDIWKLTYTLSRADGFQASPYRLVRFDADGLPPEVLLGQFESMPDLRHRHALSARYHRLLWAASALRSHARGYTDDWGVVSLTAGTEWVVTASALELGVHGRGYVQRHATFYQDVYDERRAFMTSDRELSSFWDVFAGVSVGMRTGEVGQFDEIRAQLQLTGFTFQFADFSRLPHREGLVAEASLGTTF